MLVVLSSFPLTFLELGGTCDDGAVLFLGVCFLFIDDDCDCERERGRGRGGGVFVCFFALLVRDAAAAVLFVASFFPVVFFPFTIVIA